jgi:hypothetical protein
MWSADYVKSEAKIIDWHHPRGNVLADQAMQYSEQKVKKWHNVPEPRAHPTLPSREGEIVRIS